MCRDFSLYIPSTRQHTYSLPDEALDTAEEAGAVKCCVGGECAPSIHVSQLFCRIDVPVHVRRLADALPLRVGHPVKGMLYGARISACELRCDAYRKSKQIASMTSNASPPPARRTSALVGEWCGRGSGIDGKSFDVPEEYALN